MKYSSLIRLLVLFPLIVSASQAQFYVGPMVGFKAFGLKGMATISQGGQLQQIGQADAGKTVFTVGTSIGYQIAPRSSAKVQYNLDVNLGFLYSSAGFFEQGFNKINGEGSFAANGFSGGSTTNFAFDFLPLHRLTFSNFQLLSPYAGVGLGVNMFNTSDLTQTAQGQSATATGNSEFKLGLILAYGTLFQATDNLQPYIQLKHYIPFGSTIQLTNDPQGGSIVINDVPGYFGLMVGTRFTF